MINTQSFVEIVEEMIKEKVEAPFSLGKVNPNYRGGNPQILFDGEASISIKKYPHLSSYKPVSSDRVLLINIAGTHLVIGHIGSFRETAYVYQDLESGLRNRETGWGSPVLSSSWVDYGVPYQSIQYKRDVSNFVTLRGLMKGGTTGTLFILPVGMRPPAQEIFFVGDNSTDRGDITWQDNSGENMTRIDIVKTGEVTIKSLGSNSWVTLSGIKFSVD